MDNNDYNDNDGYTISSPCEPNGSGELKKQPLNSELLFNNTDVSKIFNTEVVPLELILNLTSFCQTVLHQEVTS